MSSLRSEVTTMVQPLDAIKFRASPSMIPASGGMVCACFTTTRKPTTPATNKAMTAPITHRRLCRRTSPSDATTIGSSFVPSLIFNIDPDGSTAEFIGIVTSCVSSTFGRAISPVCSASFCSISCANELAASGSIGVGSGIFSAMPANAFPNSSAV